MNTQSVVDFLNSLLELDREWLDRLVIHTTPCDAAIGSVLPVDVVCETTFAGPLGVLNGILRAHGLPLIEAVYPDMKLRQFRVKSEDPVDGLKWDH